MSSLHMNLNRKGTHPQRPSKGRGGAREDDPWRESTAARDLQGRAARHFKGRRWGVSVVTQQITNRTRNHEV